MTDKLGTGEQNTLQLFPARPEPIYVPIILAIPIYSNFIPENLVPSPSHSWAFITLASHNVSWCLIMSHDVS